MDKSALAAHQSHRLIQVGVFLFLLGLIVGLFVPLLALPRLGLSAHLLAIIQGIFLIVIGLIWSRLNWPFRIFQLVFWLLIYGCLAAWTANLLGALLGAGNTMLPIAAGQALGNPFQETLISILLRSAAIALITSTVFIFWGLRMNSGIH